MSINQKELAVNEYIAMREGASILLYKGADPSYKYKDMLIYKYKEVYYAVGHVMSVVTGETFEEVILEVKRKCEAYSN